MRCVINIAKILIIIFPKIFTVTGKLSLFLIFSIKTSIYKAIPKVHKTLLYGKNIDGLPNIEVLSKRLKGISEITAKIKIRFKYLLLFSVL